FPITVCYAFRANDAGDDRRCYRIDGDGFLSLPVRGSRIVAYFSRVSFATERLSGPVSRAGGLALGIGIGLSGAVWPTAGVTAAERASTGPLVVNVSLSRQRLAVYDGTKRIATSPVSSG